MAAIEKYSWAGVSEFILIADALIKERLLPFPALKKESDSKLVRFGGDPGGKSWENFRPLASSREEAWSDWLQFLIENSATGFMVAELLGSKASKEVRAAKVVREVCVDSAAESAHRRRADILIYWSNGARSHVEVKIGDKSFAKTYETANALRAKVGGEPWTDHILVPGRDAALWGRESEKIHGNFELVVNLLTWEDVAVALRRTLYAGHESEIWSSLAYVFCGCVEEIALGLSSFENLKSEGVSFPKFKAAKRVDILAKAVKNDD